MRKEEALCSEELTQKRRAQDDTKDTPKPKTRHGCTSEGIDKGSLIQEEQSWSPDETVNWTALAKRYGVTTPNGGQFQNFCNNSMSQQPSSIKKKIEHLEENENDCKVE